MAEKNSLLLAREHAQKGEWADVLKIYYTYSNSDYDEDEQVEPRSKEEEELVLLGIQAFLKALPFELVGRKTKGEEDLEGFTAEQIDGILDDLDSAICDFAPLVLLADNKKEKAIEYYEKVFQLVRDDYFSMLDSYIENIDNQSGSGVNRFSSYLTGYNSMMICILKSFFKVAISNELDEDIFDTHFDEVDCIVKNKLYEKCKEVISYISAQTTEFPYFTDLDLYEKYVNAIYLSDMSLPQKDSAEKSKRIARLKSAINIRSDALNAIYVDTAREKRLSLFSAENVRNNYYSQILEFEKEIQEAESGYTHPNVRREVYSSVPLTNNSGSGGCYVATAVYGSYDCPQVWTLRRFRDNTLAKSWYGRAFICTYYAVSPTLVKWFGHTEWFKKLWQGKLDKMVAKLQSQGVESTPYQDINW